jgi:predicted transposase/invertase (TIGR01784 family)
MKTKIFFADDDDIIDICYDKVFKAVFTRETPASQGALSRLVSALIGKNVLIIRILANEPPVDSLRDRHIRYDINCRTETGELVDVEMSLNPDPFEPVRLEFHSAKLFSGQDIMGSDKDYDDLKQSYQIAILVKKRFFADNEFFHTFKYYDPEHGVSLNGRSRIITLELSKIEKSVEKPVNEMGIQEIWAVFFKYLTDRKKRSKINEIIEQEEGIAMASEVLMTISKDEHEQARLMSEEKSQLDWQSKLVHAKREGGKERDNEIARNALAKGLPLDVIHEITGLDMEKIKSLQADRIEN